MRISRLIVWVLFLAGIALLCGMVWQVGIADLLTSFRAVGFWIVPWILLESIPVVLHTAGWAACFHHRQDRIPFWRLLLIRLAGSAINQVTPTATIGGEVVKVLLLASVLPREQAAASVVIDKASFTLAQMSYLSLGHTRPTPTEPGSHRWLDFSWLAGFCRLSALWLVVQARALAGGLQHRSDQTAPLAAVSAPPGSPPGGILYVASVVVCRVARAAFPGFCLWEHPNLSIAAPAARHQCPTARRRCHRGGGHSRAGPDVFLCAGQPGHL